MSGSDLGPDWKKRRAAVPLPQGDPCPFCRKPMWPDMPLDMDHEVPRAYGGHDGPLRWAHRRCNQLAGARMGGRMRSRVRKAPRRWIDRWA